MRCLFFLHVIPMSNHEFFSSVCNAFSKRKTFFMTMSTSYVVPISSIFLFIIILTRGVVWSRNPLIWWVLLVCVLSRWYCWWRIQKIWYRIGNFPIREREWSTILWIVLTFWMCHYLFLFGVSYYFLCSLVFGFVFYLLLCCAQWVFFVSKSGRAHWTVVLWIISLFVCGVWSILV